MTQLLRYSHAFVRRRLDAIERLLLASVLALLLWVWMRTLPAYPPFWDVVLVGVVFIAALWSPAVGYFLSVLAAAYPLYLVSIYLAVLFLVAALLGQRIILRNLGAALLTAAAPALTPYFLPWAIPVLGGLWWGATAGAVMGGLAALGGQVLAGMTGANPDWLARLGLALNGAKMTERFAGADSLDTLWLIVEPLTPDSTVLLHFLLQVVLWAAVGGLVGSLAERDWAQQRRPWVNIFLAWAGIAVLAGGHLIIGQWLGIYSSERLAGLWQPTLLTAAMAALASALLEGLRDLVEHPLPRLGRRDALPVTRATQPPPAPLPRPALSELDKKDAEEDDTNDLIMLELE